MSRSTRRPLARPTTWIQATRRAGYWRDCVALVSHWTPAEYLEHLRSQRVQTLIAGAEHVDIRAALEELRQRFNVRTVRVDSGGALIRVLLRACLVDEISLLVHPVLVGDTSHNVLFAPDNCPAEATINARLESVELLENGVVWLRYALRVGVDLSCEAEASSYDGWTRGPRGESYWPPRYFLQASSRRQCSAMGKLPAPPDAGPSCSAPWLATGSARPRAFVPLVAMGIEMLTGIPATLVQPGPETPISVVLEAPFWTGMPALIGALIGGAMRAVVDRHDHTPPLELRPPPQLVGRFRSRRSPEESPGRRPARNRGRLVTPGVRAGTISAKENK